LALRLSVELPPDRHAPTLARRFIAATCDANGIEPERSANAALLVGELTSNVVLHAGTDAVVTLIAEDDRLTVEVKDLDPSSNVRLLDLNPTLERGRGLHLVSALALAWGSHKDAVSKTVWFEV
jgi:anti-sigma regulatory factor (Ser/Thr protein kinase)